jgi:DNA-binding protein YbaB
MPVDPDAAGALIADLTRRMQSLREMTFTGSDSASLVQATVDGDGLVTEIRFARTISRHRSPEVGEAIVAAIEDAQAKLAGAYTGLAEDAEKWEHET